MRLCAFADEAGSALTAQIAALQRNNIPLLEIRGVDGENIKDIKTAKLYEIKARLDEAGIGVWSIGSPIGKYPIAENLEPHIEAFKHVLHAAEVLGAENIRMFSFYPAPGDSPAVTVEKVIERLEKLVALTPAHITLCHENEKDIFGETPDQCLAVHRALPSIRAVFDPANFIQCGVDTSAAWEEMKPYVKYLHIKDAAADGTVVPAGKGLGQLPEIIGDYLARGGEVMTLEPHLTVFEGLSALENGAVSVKAEKMVYRTQDEAFDAAANALKAILKI